MSFVDLPSTFQTTGNGDLGSLPLDVPILYPQQHASAAPMMRSCVAEADQSGFSFAENDGMAIRQISNRRLRESDIPGPPADWHAISEFALSFDGYQVWGSFETCAQIANARRAQSLTDLRTCLFFEQRRWRHFGEEPDDEAMAYIRGIIEQIRGLVRNRTE